MLNEPTPAGHEASDRRQFLLVPAASCSRRCARHASHPGPCRDPAADRARTIAAGRPGHPRRRRLRRRRRSSTTRASTARARSRSPTARARPMLRGRSPARGARKSRSPPRSGGHSYGGYSTGSGLVLDVSRMHGVQLANGIATVGAGAQLIDVYTALAASRPHDPRRLLPHRRHRGPRARRRRRLQLAPARHDLDTIVGLTLVDASGRIRTCSATENANLFWACRGGGGGNFGVVTSFRFRTFPVSTVTTFEMSWPWAEAARPSRPGRRSRRTRRTRSSRSARC